VDSAPACQLNLRTIVWTFARRSVSLFIAIRCA
jgi:hypothetical protein